MKRRRNDIKNEMAYFNKVTQNMDCKEKIKQDKIEDNEIFVEYPSVSSDFLADFDLEKEITDLNLLAWIDMIENPKLHAAVKSLSLDEQTLLSYIFEKKKTQRDLEKTYKIKQRNICNKINKIICKLKGILCDREKNEKT